MGAASGEVRYVGPGEDYETGAGPWELEVQVTDLEGLADQAQVTLVLSNDNEAPTFADTAYAFKLKENARGPLVLGQVSASDPDGSDQLSYGLAEGDAERFEVGAASGEVRYAGPGEDAETGPESYELKVTATDPGGLRATATVTVTVLDQNEAPVFREENWEWEVEENVVGPFELGVAVAMDPDRSDTLTYRLRDEDAKRFEVHATSGAVRYVGPGEDAETGQDAYEFAVVATDREGLWDQASVVVRVLNVNEAPVFADTAYVFTLPENAAGPWDVGEVSASDVDEGDLLAYRLISGDQTRFEVHATSGAVRYVGPGEDYEDGPPSYVLSVRVTDGGGLTDEAAVTVTVLNVNEGPVAVGSIAPRTLEAYGTAWEEELGPYFRDPDGDALSYQAESASPTVALTAVSGAGRLSVIPQAIGATVVRVTASDPEGLATVQEVHVAVVASRSERARAMKLALAAFGRSLGTETVEAIGGRLGMESSGSLGQSHVQVGGRSVGCGRLAGTGGQRCGLEALLRGASALSGMHLERPGAAGSQLGASAGQPDGANRQDQGGLTFNPVSRQDLRSRSSFQLSGSGWTLWGQANAGEFEGNPDDGFALEGRTRSAYAGLDYRFGSGLLLGLAGSRSGMESDFESGINGAGSVDARLTSLYPYLHWSPREGLGLWGAAGAGRGNADLEELAGGRFSTSLSMRMGAAGVRQELVGALALKADAFSVRIQSADATELAGVTANAQRVRLAPELSAQWAVGGASVRTRLELGGRLDRGDAETGMGAEAGAELGFTHRASGFSVDARGRTLLVHQAEDFKEWNASVALRLQPGRDQGGLSFSLEPSWGTGGTGAPALWQTHGRLSPQAMGTQTMAQDVDAPGLIPDRLAMELGWSAVLPGGGRVRPFGRWSREGADGYRLNVGTQWSVLGQPGGGQGQGAQGLRLMIDLFGEQANTSLQPSERRMGLLGRINFR